MESCLYIDARSLNATTYRILTLTEIVPFGILCRRYRKERGLFLADQAESTGLSTSYISAMETGARPIPDGYPAKVANWLGILPKDKLELEESVASSSNVIKFRPKTAASAELAFVLSRRLNELTPNEIRKLKNIIERGGNVEH